MIEDKDQRLVTMAGTTLIYQRVTSIEVVQIDYRYLGSTIHNNGEMKEDVANKIRTCWLKSKCFRCTI